MKKPFVLIAATCHKHGALHVERKPNSARPASGMAPTSFYQAVTCPKCRTWASIEQQTLITEAAEPVHEQLALPWVTHG